MHDTSRALHVSDSETCQIKSSTHKTRTRARTAAAHPHVRLDALRRVQQNRHGLLQAPQRLPQAGKVGPTQRRATDAACTRARAYTHTWTRVTLCSL